MNISTVKSLSFILYPLSCRKSLFHTSARLLHPKNIFQIAILITLLPFYAFSQISLDKPLLPKWHYEGQTNSTSINVQNSRVIFPQIDGSIVALDLSSGTLLWKTAIGGDIKFYPTISNELAFVSSSANNNMSNIIYYLNALRVDNGVTIWRRNFRFPFILSNSSSPKQILVSQENQTLLTLYNVQRESGEITPINSFLVAPDKKIQLFDETIFIKTKKTELEAFNFVTGKKLWTFQNSTEINSFLVSSKDNLYLSTVDGKIISLNTMTGRLYWQKKASNKLQTLVQTTEGIIVITPENKFFLYTPKGKLKWKKLIEGRVSNNLAVYNGYLIIFPTASNTGIILNLENGKTYNRITLEPEQYVVAPPVVTDQILLLLTQKGLLALANQ